MSLPDLKNQDIFYVDGIKGISYTQITKNFVYKLFYAFVKLTDSNTILIANDFRNSSKDFFKILNLASTHLNKKIIYAGDISYDVFQYLNTLNISDSAIYISPQHGDHNYAGFKLFYKNNYEVNYDDIKELISNENAEFNNNINYSELNNYECINPYKEYFDIILKNINSSEVKEFKIIIDGGNGMGGISFKKILSKFPQLNCITINTEPNELFPHHIPNPLVYENNKKLIKKILDEKADFGVSLDQDGNSLLLVDEKGNLINPNHLSILLLKILSVCDNKNIGIDKKQIINLENKAKEFGLNPVLINSDFKEINNALRELNLNFSSESNGTYYYKDLNYTSSSIYTVLLILGYLTNNNISLSESILSLNNNTELSWQHNFLLFENYNFEEIINTLTLEFTDCIPEKNNNGLILKNDNYRISINIYRRHFLQLYIEALGDLLLKELENKLISKISQFGQFIKAQHEEIDIEIYNANNFNKFETLLNNLWFTWNPHYILPIIDMYGDGWRKNVPPEAIIANYGKNKLESILKENEWELNQNLRLYYNYFSRKSKFELFIENNNKFEKLIDNPIAYFCMEYGLIDWLQIYSGGLGVLAGDYLKEASDFGLPVVAIGLFYHQGYLHQDFAPDGRQLEDYIHQDPMDFNLELIKNSDGSQLIIDVLLNDHLVKVRAWKLKVGMNDLYLLDTNFEENEEWEDRLITGYLYGGDLENRIRQELVLAYAGMRLIDKLGINPSILHMNEGHSGFIVFEQALMLMNKENLSFNEALNKAEEKLVFTNHTLKQAGNDVFDFFLFEKYLSHTANELGVNVSKLYSLAEEKQYSTEGFSMTIFGMKNAKVSNAVSKLHSFAAKKVWPNFDLLPVTNGVHMPTWICPEIHELLDEYLGEGWHLCCSKMDFDKIQKIPKQRLWEAKKIRKHKLIESLNNELGLNLKENILTITWSRRLAAYKRPDLLISDIERLKKIINNSDKPVQILIAGKSHPKDTIGKEILMKMNQVFSSNEFNNKIEIIPGYNWQLARRMVSGSDIWLNTPYRYEEASGTSGMKASANGVIQFTTRDGWTDEVNWYKIGWEISEENSAESLYSILENEIIPLYYNINENDYNKEWLEMMINSIQMAIKDFSTERMLIDYLNNIYSKIL